MYQAHNIFNDRINPVAEEDKVPQRSTPIMPICIVKKDEGARSFWNDGDKYLTDALKDD